MARVLVLYGTAEDQTARISEYVAEVAGDQGHEAQALDIKGLSGGSSLGEYEAVVVGASIHKGEHEKYVRDFVKENRESLERVPSSFFSVSITAAEKTEEARSQVEEYVEKFLQETGWRPCSIGVLPASWLTPATGS